MLPAFFVRKALIEMIARTCALAYDTQRSATGLLSLTAGVIPMTHRAGAFCLTIALGVLTLPSCGGPENVSGVSGKVTLDGQPLPDAMVTFSPNKPEGSAAIGKTDSGGQYKLSYPGGFSGAHLGENRVIISTYVAGDPDADPPRPAVPEKVPAQYNTNTTLKADVKDGSNTFDWPLKSGGPIANPAAPGRADPDSCE